MRIENRNMRWTLMPLFLAGVLCNTRRVEYHQQRVCAVNGSYVVIPCSFYYPDNHSGERFKWGHVKSHSKGRYIYDSNSKKVTTRFQYIGDKKHNCSLKIHHVEHHDAGKYTFRFTTDLEDGKWTGKVGLTLKVVDLNISVTRPDGNRTTKEGDSVNMTCVNVCDDDNLSSAFIWFKNGEPIKEGPVLYLSNMSSTNSGNYSCSLKTHTGTASGVIHIDVQYGPKNTSVSVRPSTEVDFGSTITLICSSHANPPVEDYTWFKIYDDDDDDIMDVGHRPEFLPADGGQYLCSATNEHGSQNSSVVTIKIKPYWATLSTRDVLIIAAVAVLLIVITVIALRRLHKKRMCTPKTDSEEDIQETDYVNWLAGDNNQSQEGNQCEGGGTAEVIYTTVYFNNKTKSNMEQQMDSQPDDYENVIYISLQKPAVEPFVH
ncbi:B-cell receptor CD22-like [Anarrhichthys ocellatus]|uniref:B-cell receptor CD22-like n=1 Tax=Anarrhichthys ocellatus TaxID=433405 RepID=UPI0012ED8850|nr:B-cell receptor CD22-like [Anarrhichthys ocellatus]